VHVVGQKGKVLVASSGLITARQHRTSAPPVSTARCCRVVIAVAYSR
jgi:hypothetical protein